MPLFFSTDFQEMSTPGTCPALTVAAQTLGELVRKLDTEHDVRLVANPDGDKYFRYYYPAASQTWLLVDVHAERGNDWVCPKQDLSFALLPSDRIHAGMLLC